MLGDKHKHIILNNENEISYTLLISITWYLLIVGLAEWSGSK